MHSSAFCIQNQKFPMAAGWGNFKVISILFQSLFQFKVLGHSRHYLPFPLPTPSFPAPTGFPARTESATAHFQSHLTESLRAFNPHGAGWNGISPRVFSCSSQRALHCTLLIPQNAAASSLNPKNLNHGSCLQEPDEFSMHLPASYHFLLCNIRHEWLISFSHMPAQTQIPIISSVSLHKLPLNPIFAYLLVCTASSRKQHLCFGRFY